MEKKEEEKYTKKQKKLGSFLVCGKPWTVHHKIRNISCVVKNILQ